MAKQGAIDTEALRQKTAERAYLIWESVGRPHGYDQQHWAQAEAEVLGNPRAAGKRTTAASKGATATKSTVTAPKKAAAAKTAVTSKTALKAMAAGESAPKTTAKKTTRTPARKK